MPDLSIISNILGELGIPVAGHIVQDAAGDGRCFVFIATTRDADNRQVPSNRKLKEAEDLLAQQGLVVNFVLTDGQRQDVEAGLRATLLHSFGRQIRNAFLSMEGSGATVWLDPKADLEAAQMDEIKEKAVLFLAEVGIELGGLTTTRAQNVASKTACLRAIRQLSPVLPLRLKEHLQESGFAVPSDDWVSRRLDALRKMKLVVRLSSGRYAVTLDGLKALGTAKNAASPDLARLLALAAGKH